MNAAEIARLRSIAQDKDPILFLREFGKESTILSLLDAPQDGAETVKIARAALAEIEKECEG